MTSAPPPRQYLHLHPLTPSQIPSHPLLATQSQQSTSHPSLRTFISELLTESIHFSEQSIHTNFKPKGAPKSSKPSTAPVQLLTWTGEGAGRGGGGGANGSGEKENWFARRSVHEDARKSGTADWEEFVDGLYREHSRHEMEYTPDVYDAHEVLNWNDELAELNAQGWGNEMWSEVGMEIYEMAHHIPFPLNNRIFPVLIVRALLHQQQPSPNTTTTTTSTPHTDGHPPHTSPTEADSFIVIQLPLDLSYTPTPHSLYSSGRHRTTGSSSAEQRANVTMGRYVSVEYVKRVEYARAGAVEGEGEAGVVEVGKVEWVMATASDAGGNLPMGVQKMGVPGAVVKDVGLFVGWVGERRR